MLPTTYLFVPGDRPERFRKAQESGADMVVLDLEDAVSIENKAAARTNAAAALGGNDFRACIRINGSESQWFAEDCRLLSLPGIAAVMLSKAESVDPLDRVRAALGRTLPLIPIVETARGLAAAAQLAACANVERLVFGSVDFQLDLGIEGDGLELLLARSLLVWASRLAGIGAPVDGATLTVHDAKKTRNDALRARRLGFGAKLCIHPVQVATIKEVFMPDARTAAWARGVLSAAASISSGAFMFERKLVDKPVIDRAHAILQRLRP